MFKNKLMPLLKSRLRSTGMSKAKDVHDNDIYLNCEIFSDTLLSDFLDLSLREFNQVPYFTNYSFDDDKFVNQFGEIIIEGAAVYALASQALLERGREFQITDDTISFTPPTVSELLNTQYQVLLNHHWDKLKLIKNHIKEYSM